ncbi:MAG TPA: NAD(P)-dependent oxidoreductase [Planctomycetes bacterium]|nr:NAD(P)-dependent oxidoreductase [Planctomycetota bacterium]
MKIAVIGLGTMGGPMAKNLLAKGFEVRVHNRTREKEIPLEALGAERAASPAKAARGADVTLTCVSDTPDVEAVLLAPETGAIHGMSRGSLVIDCSTISPDATRDFAARFSKIGVGYVDAPVSGGSEGALNATLAIMCGGSEEDFERARPVLQAIGRSITHVGPTGSGQVAKAVNQVVIAGTYLSVAEGLTLAAKSGVDPQAVVEAIRGGAAASWVLDNRSANMIRNTYPLGFRLQLHRKDLGIALDAGEHSGAAMRLARLVADIEDRLIEEGFGDEDMSAIARAVRRESHWD